MIPTSIGVPQIWAFAAIAGAYIIHLMFPGQLGWGDAHVLAALAGSGPHTSAPPAIRAAFAEENPSVCPGMIVA